MIPPRRRGRPQPLPQPPPHAPRPDQPGGGEGIRYVVLGGQGGEQAPAETPVERRWHLVRQVALGFVPIAFFGFFVLLVVHELRRGSVEVARIEVPAKLVEAGLTPEVVARRLVDALDRAGDAAQAETARRRMAQLAAMTPDFSVPVAGISLRSLAELVRDLLTLPKIEISGEVTLVDEQLALRLRLYRRGEVVSLSGFAPNQVDALLEAAAPGLWRVLQPQVYAWHIAETLADQEEVIRRLAALRIEADVDQAARDTAAYLTGQAMLRAGRPEEALGLFQALARERPGYAQGALGAATALAALDRGEEAIAAHAEAVRRHGSTIWTHLSAGRLMLEVDRPLLALAEAEAGLRIDAAAGELLLLRIAALAGAGRGAEALAEARRWRAERPDLAAAHLAEGIALRGPGRDLPGALAACRRAVGLAGPGPGAVAAEARFCVGEALLASAEAGPTAAAARAEGLAALEAAAAAAQRAEPALAARALLLRGEALAAAGEAEAALGAFDAALMLRPRRVAGLRGRAAALETLGRREEAVAAWRRLAMLAGDGGGGEGGGEAVLALERLGATAPR